MTCSGIEVVITSTIGNRVAAKTARGFESLPLRQRKACNPKGYRLLLCPLTLILTLMRFQWSGQALIDTDAPPRNASHFNDAVNHPVCS